MELTPESFLKKVPHKTGMTIIEHVNVQEEYLIEFQNIMINNNTPAMKYIIEKKIGVMSLSLLKRRIFYIMMLLLNHGIRFI